MISSAQSFLGKLNPFSYLSTPAPEMNEIPIFGAAEYRKYFGKANSVPAIPASLIDYSERDCPFWPDKKVKETHMLFLVPTSVNGKPLNLEHLLDLAQTALPQSRQIKACVSSLQTVKALGKPQWVLMTKQPIPQTCDLAFEKQLEKLEEYGYELPSPVQAGICILAAYLSADLSLFPSERHYTRCQGSKSEWPVAVGNTGDGSLVFTSDDWSLPNGIAGVRTS